MDVKETRKHVKPKRNGFHAEILASAADQLAGIIHEVTKYREIERYDTERTQPLRPWGVSYYPEPLLSPGYHNLV